MVSELLALGQVDIQGFVDLLDVDLRP